LFALGTNRLADDDDGSASDVVQVILDCKARRRPPLWSSGQSSWLQIRRSRVRFPALQTKELGLERGPLSLVNATDELHGRNSSGSGLKSRKYGRRDSSR
jgi:hypothetical protein